MTEEEKTEVTTTMTTEEMVKKSSPFYFEKKTVTLPVNCSTVKRMCATMDAIETIAIFVCRLLASVFGVVTTIFAVYAGWRHEIGPMIVILMVIVGFVIFFAGLDMFPYKFVCTKDEPEDKNEL